MTEENEPETAKLLDEIREWFRAHVVASDSVITMLILLPGAAWAGGVNGAFPTMPRALLLGSAESGKTTGMNVSASLGPNPTDADGTYADLQSALAEAANTPENPLRIFYFDEIGEIYGDDGQNKGANRTLNKLLRKGYKLGATDGRSRQGVSRKFSIFFPVIMTGRNIALPVDIRSRTIVGNMSAATPERYFDVRESEGEAEEYSAALGRVVKEHLEELKAFRGRGYHPRLTGRKLEVWEPLFAVAKVLGGQRWLNMCLSAFLELALASEQVTLTPRQRVLRDMNEILDEVMFLLPNGRGFAGGEALADELKHHDPERYGDLGMTQVIARNMRPVEPHQVRVGTARTRGYYTEDIRKTWEEIKPEGLRNAEASPDDDPFDVTDGLGDDSEEVFEMPPVTSNGHRVTKSRTITARK